MSSLIIGIKHQHRGVVIGVRRHYSSSTPSQLHALSTSTSVTTNGGNNGVNTAIAQDENIEWQQQQRQSRRTALSIPIDELSVILGGTGRARLAWDCYVNGADPQYLFGDVSSSSSSSECDEYKDVEYVKRQVIPTPRQTQPLGSMALNKLSTLHSHCGTNSSIENGLATLIHISSSMDGTTKLLLRLVDGLEVETVLIPFYSTHVAAAVVANTINTNFTNTNQILPPPLGRTTVCVSSQVGCLQGCTFCATGKMGHRFSGDLWRR